MRVLVVVLLLLVTGLAQAGEATGRTLVVGSEQDFPPFAVGTTDDTAGGFTVDLWKAVAAESGINYTIRVRPFHQILEEFREGKIDVLINLAQSGERRQFADFTVPNVIVNGAIFVRKGERRIRSEADLADKSIIVLKADLAHDYALSRGWQKQLVLVDTAADGFALLASGQHDAMLLSKLAGVQTLEKLALSNIKALDEKAGFSQKFSFAVHKGESELLARINEGLSLTKSSGAYNAAYDKWFGIYEEQQLLSRVLLKYIAPVTVVLLLIGGLALHKRRTERKLAEAEKRKYADRLRLAMEVGAIGFFDADLRVGSVVADHQTRTILGMPEGPLTVRAVKALMYPDDRDRVMGDVATATDPRNREDVAFENRIVRPDGAVRWVATRGRFVFDEGPGPARAAGFVGVVQDITERKRTEDALRDSEEHFRAVFDQAADAIFVHDLNGRFLEVNRTACEILGYAREELLGMTVMDIEQDFRPENGVWAQVEAGQLVAVDGRHKRKDGLVLPVEVRLGSLNLRGECRIIALVRDVTELRTAERNLRESEARLQLALDASNVGLWDWDLRSGLAYLTPHYYEMTGYSPDEVTPDLDFFKRLIHPEDRAHALSTMEAHLAGKSAESVFDYRMVTKSGVVKWVQGKGKVVERAADGAPLRMVGTISDITERKRAEEQLRKLSLAVEQSPESIVITNTAAEIEYVNEAFTRTTGYSLAEAMGQNPRILQTGRTPPATYAAMWEVLQQGHSWKGEFCNRRKDGSEYTEFAIIAPIREADGRITHYVAVKEDISEKKRVGEELDQYRHHLEELVEQRTAELAMARDVAQAASRAKSSFLANMSHEIRTPLNGVLGLAQIGYRDSGERPKTRETFARIVESGKLLLGVINDILDFSKIEAGKLQIEQVDTRPGEAIDRIVELTAARARAKGLSLTTEKAADLPAICLSDPLRLQQILLNLLANAIKFTEHGSVTVRASRRGEHLRFAVIDTGIGMSREEIERIFAPFEQADTSTTRRFGGTGLGLAITHRLVELMGGEIIVDSAPGVGSTFTVSLPYHAAAPAAQPVAEQQQAVVERPGRRLAGLSILVAEDNDINQMVIEELLVSEGAAVVMVGDGAEAVDCVKSQGAGAFDLVLMDVQMPQMDGYEATGRILKIAPGLSIVGQTAHAMAEERSKCLAAGMVDHIAKPIDPDELVAVVLRHARTARGTAPVRIEWDESYSVGVMELDRHHQALARLINKCAEKVSCAADPEHFDDALTALVNYANYHFAYEEKLLADNGYADLGEQIAEHTEFSRVVADASYEAIHGQADIARLLDYLNAWWRDHILKVDMKYKDFCQTRQL